jgi:hypothetical protein
VLTLQGHNSTQNDAVAVAAFFVCRAADTLMPVRLCAVAASTHFYRAHRLFA